MRVAALSLMFLHMHVGLFYQVSWLAKCRIQSCLNIPAAVKCVIKCCMRMAARTLEEAAHCAVKSMVMYEAGRWLDVDFAWAACLTMASPNPLVTACMMAVASGNGAAVVPIVAWLTDLQFHSAVCRACIVSCGYFVCAEPSINMVVIMTECFLRPCFPVVSKILTWRS